MFFNFITYNINMNTILYSLSTPGKISRIEPHWLYFLFAGITFLFLILFLFLTYKALKNKNEHISEYENWFIKTYKENRIFFYVILDIVCLATIIFLFLAGSGSLKYI